MPKLNARVVIALLISLAVILAIATTVYARANHAGTSIFSNTNTHATVSGRANVSARTNIDSQYQTVSPHSGHDCGNPNPAIDD